MLPFTDCMGNRIGLAWLWRHKHTLCCCRLAWFYNLTFLRPPKPTFWHRTILLFPFSRGYFLAMPIIAGLQFPFTHTLDHLWSGPYLVCYSRFGHLSFQALSTYSNSIPFISSVISIPLILQQNEWALPKQSSVSYQHKGHKKGGNLTPESQRISYQLEGGMNGKFYLHIKWAVVYWHGKAQSAVGLALSSSQLLQFTLNCSHFRSRQNLNLDILLTECKRPEKL